MEFWQAVILSIVEGISEFLPISSTGHLVLATDLLKISQTDFVKNFEISIQLGAIASVVVIYFKTLTSDFKVWQKIVLGFIPTGILGFIFYDLIKEVLLGNLYVTLLALFLGGVILIILEKMYTEKQHHVESLDNISLKQAFLIGVCQSVSMIPGVSRAAATIVGGMFLGLKREAATGFSFLLAIPTMGAATVFDLLKADLNFSSNELFILLTGFLGSFITALLVVKFLTSYVKHHTFIPFGVYRIILTVVYWLLVIN